MTVLPDGAFPVMLTPFAADGSVDLPALDRYTDWLIDKGAAGLFPVALSGEMFQLSEEERLVVAARVVQRAGGRVPVLASVVEFGTAGQVAEASARLAATGVDVVVLVASVLLAEGESEAVLHAKIDAALAAAPDVDFGIYECPLPYHRLISEEALSRLALSGRFTFFKETSHDIDRMRRRVAAVEGTRLKVYNAGIETLVPSLQVGVRGLSGWVVNIYPDLVQWIVENESSSHAPSMQDALDVMERRMGPTYPASAKVLIDQRAGLGMGVAGRWQPAAVDATEMASLREHVEDVAAAGGIW